MTRQNQQKILNSDIPILQQQLESVDIALLNHFNETLQLHAIENGKKVNLTTTIAQAEKWFQMQRQRGKRDEHKATIYPVASLRRGAITPNNDMFVYNKNQATMIPVSKKLSEENNYKDKQPGTEIYDVKLVSPPVAVDIDYEFNLQTKYMETANTIIEQIIVYHGKQDIVTQDGFTLRMNIDSFSDNSNLDDIGTENAIFDFSASFTISCLLSLNIRSNKVNIKKVRTPAKFTFTEKFL